MPSIDYQIIKRYVDLAKDDQIAWDKFVDFMDTFTPTVTKCKILISILLKEMKAYKDKEIKSNPTPEAIQHDFNLLDKKVTEAVNQIFTNDNDHFVQKVYQETHGNVENNDIFNKNVEVVEEIEKPKAIQQTFKCSKCSKIFISLITCQIHYNKAHKTTEKKFKCQKCDQNFDLEVGLRSHVMELHSKFSDERSNARVKANVTPKAEFTNVNHSVDEQMDQYDHENVEDIDDYEVVEPETIEKVETPESIQPRWKCSQCPKFFNDVTAIQNHFDHDHKPAVSNFKCQKCDRGFESEILLRNHIMTSHSKFSENPEGATIKNKMNKATNEDVYNFNNSNNEEMGEIATEIFENTNISQVVKQQNVENAELPIAKEIKKEKPIRQTMKCNQCLKVFSYKLAFQNHVSKAHKKVELTNFKCQKCDKGFDLEAALRNHIMSMHSKFSVTNLLFKITLARHTKK